MSGRTLAIGDIHGHRLALQSVLAQLPTLDAEDTLVFIGDYLDRGPESAGVVRLIREDLPTQIPAQIVTLRGNHEDAWLATIRGETPDFPIMTGNGCLSTLRSFTGGGIPDLHDFPQDPREVRLLTSGGFFPPDVLVWMNSLPYFYEDDHAIYVHGGITPIRGKWVHPSLHTQLKSLIWCRDSRFFSDYRGKRVVFGHTPSLNLRQLLQIKAPADPNGLFVHGSVVGIDTGCGHGGYLSCLELPSMKVYCSSGVALVSATQAC